MAGGAEARWWSWAGCEVLVWGVLNDRPPEVSIQTPMHHYRMRWKGRDLERGGGANDKPLQISTQGNGRGAAALGPRLLWDVEGDHGMAKDGACRDVGRQ